MPEIQTYPDGTPTGGDKVPYVEDPAGTPALKLADASALGGGGGGSVLALATINHATQQNITNPTTVVNASLSVTFIAPASASVVVILQASAYGNPGDSATHWRLVEGGTVVANTSKVISAVASGSQTPYMVLIPVDGLIPGVAYTWDWGHTGSYPGGGYATVYGGIYGAAVMMVLAA